ncbi:MAG: GspH/FimT family pseudopilin [Betaproteobacteria bacterium]
MVEVIPWAALPPDGRAELNASDVNILVLKYLLSTLDFGIHPLAFVNGLHGLRRMANWRVQRRFLAWLPSRIESAEAEMHRRAENPKLYWVGASGFGLTELLVGLAIAAMLLGLGVPGYHEWIANSELMNEARQLADNMNRARAEAIKSGLRVNLCQSAGGPGCVPVGAWDQGWILFLDTNGNGDVDSGEPILWTGERAPPGVTVAANGPLKHYVSYTSMGHARMLNGALQMGTFTVCRSGRKAVDVVLAHSGRVRIAKTGAICP